MFDNKIITKCYIVFIKIHMNFNFQKHKELFFVWVKNKKRHSNAISPRKLWKVTLRQTIMNQLYSKMRSSTLKYNNYNCILRQIVLFALICNPLWYHFILKLCYVIVYGSRYIFLVLIQMSFTYYFNWNFIYKLCIKLNIKKNLKNILIELRVFKKNDLWYV